MMDSDDDISLGITAEEEEQLLLQFASHSPSSPLYSGSAAAIDSIPRKLGTFPDQHDAQKLGDAIASGAPKPVAVTHPQALERHSSAISRPEDLVPQLFPPAEVIYPNRKTSPRHFVSGSD
jgi:hypothetical protein